MGGPFLACSPEAAMLVTFGENPIVWVALNSQPQTFVSVRLQDRSGRKQRQNSS